MDRPFLLVAFAVVLALAIGRTLHAQDGGTGKRTSPLSVTELLFLVDVGYEPDELVATVRARGLALPRDGRRSVSLRGRGFDAALVSRIVEAADDAAASRRSKENTRGATHHDPALDLHFQRRADLEWTRHESGGRLNLRGLPAGTSATLDYRALDLPHRELGRRGLRDLGRLFARRCDEITATDKGWLRDSRRLVRIGSHFGIAARMVGPAKKAGSRVVYDLTWIPRDGALLSIALRIEEPGAKVTRALSPHEPRLRRALHSFGRPGEVARALPLIWFLDGQGTPRHFRPGFLDEPETHPARGRRDAVAIGPGFDNFVVTVARGRRLGGIPRDERRVGEVYLLQADRPIRRVRPGALAGGLDLTLDAPGTGRTWLGVDAFPVGAEDGETFRTRVRVDYPAGAGSILTGHRGSPWRVRREKGDLVLVMDDETVIALPRLAGTLVDAEIAPRPGPPERNPSLLVLTRERLQGVAGVDAEAKVQPDRIAILDLPLNGGAVRELWAERITADAQGGLRIAATTDGDAVLFSAPGAGLSLLPADSPLPIRLLPPGAVRDFALGAP